MSNVTHEDPFSDGYTGPPSAEAIKLESVGDWITLRVSEVGDPFEAEYGQVFVISGEVVGKGGPTVESPEVGESAGYMISWEKANGKLPHVREEIQKAIKAAGRRDGSIREGDVIAVKRDEDVLKSKTGKKFANPFRHHLVRVIELGETTPASDDPWGDVPMG